MAKKVLIISYYYPPENSISSRRPLAFAKAFQQAGYDVTVLTRHRDINNFQSYVDLNAPSNKLNSAQFEEGIKTVRIGFRHIKPLSFLLKYGFSFTDILFVLRSLFKRGINIELDVFHNFYAFLRDQLK